VSATAWTPVSERRLHQVLTERIGRLIWLTLAGYAALVVVVFAALSELALQRSLDQSADVVQSLIGLYADPAGERTTVAPAMLAERLIGTGEPFLITRATSLGPADRDRTIYFLSPTMPATQVVSPEADASADAVREQLLRALAERGRWRHAVLQRHVGEFDIYVARRRDSYLLAVAGLAGAALLLLPVAALLARRSMTRAVSSALAPLARVVGETRLIGPGDLSRRMPAPTGVVEVSELSEALNRLLERVERSHRALEGFTADASHELRTPLTHIRAQAQWSLDDRRSQADQRDALAGIARETEDMIRMVEDLLLIARGENQQLAVARREFDLAEVAREVEEIAAAMAKERDLRVRAEVNGPIRAVGDAGHTREILLNLASNAVRHTSAGGVVLTCERGEGVVGIAVRDTGCGIEPQHLGRIFDRFYRVDRSRSRSHGGAGLGLTIARLLAELQHGRIEVTSTPGQGSTFTLWLPSPELLPAMREA
jgi:signal transduction histidine kinase